MRYGTISFPKHSLLCSKKSLLGSAVPSCGSLWSDDLETRSRTYQRTAHLDGPPGPPRVVRSPARTNSRAKSSCLFYTGHLSKKCGLRKEPAKEGLVRTRQMQLRFKFAGQGLPIVSDRYPILEKIPFLRASHDPVHSCGAQLRDSACRPKPAPS